MLEMLEENYSDAAVKVIVDADEKDFIASEVQAILAYDGAIVFAPYKLKDDVPLVLDSKESNEELN
jgi:hypothetical protein